MQQSRLSGISPQTPEWRHGHVSAQLQERHADTAARLRTLHDGTAEALPCIRGPLITTAAHDASIAVQSLH